MILAGSKGPFTSSSLIVPGVIFFNEDVVAVVVCAVHSFAEVRSIYRGYSLCHLPVGAGALDFGTCGNDFVAYAVKPVYSAPTVVTVALVSIFQISRSASSPDQSFTVPRI